MAPSDSGEQAAFTPEIEKLSHQLAKDPRSKAFIPLAEEYVKIGMLQEAATVLEEGLKVYPAFITALVALGRVYVQLDAPGKAQGILEEAVKNSPDNVLAHKMLARIYAKEQNWDAAKRSCEMVLFGYPKDEEMLALKAELAGQGASDAVAPSLRPAAKTPAGKTGRRKEAAPASSKAGGPAEGPTVGQNPSDREAEAAVAAAGGPQAGTGERLDQSDAPGAERSETEAQTGVAHLQELLERVRQRRAS